MRGQFSKSKMGFIGLAVLIPLLAACACEENGGKGVPQKCPTGYLLEVSIEGGASPRASLAPPERIGDSCFKRAGLSLQSETNNVQVEIVSVNLVGAQVEDTLKVTNTSTATLRRVWLIAKPLVGSVRVDSNKADGYVGEGNYFYLKNLDPGESADVVIDFNLFYTADYFSAIVDVVSVGERIAFQYFAPNGTTEIRTVNTEGADQFSAVAVSPDSAIVPVCSNDGGWMAFAWGLPSVADIGLARADGGGAVKLTCFGEGGDYSSPGGFTPDGKKLYIRHFDSSLGTGDIYLLDIDQARNDCSSPVSLTPLTVSTAEAVSETVGLPAPDGSVLLFGRVEQRTVEPPYQQGNSNPTCCPDWSFGSEAKYNVTNLYLMPLDSATGLPTGPEVLYWEDAKVFGAPSMAPDSKGVILKTAGGCTKGLKYGCNTACQWVYQCITSGTGVDWIPGGLYRLEIPDPAQWSTVLPYNYADNTGAYTLYDFDGIKFYGPSWCWESDRVIWTDPNNDLWGCDPLNCGDTKKLLVDDPASIAIPTCTPAVADP